MNSNTRGMNVFHRKMLKPFFVAIGSFLLLNLLRICAYASTYVRLTRILLQLRFPSPFSSQHAPTSRRLRTRNVTSVYYHLRLASYRNGTINSIKIISVFVVFLRHEYYVRTKGILRYQTLQGAVCIVNNTSK